jgi:hypothetical protein
MYEISQRKNCIPFTHICLFFFKAFWHPDAGPVSGPKHVAVLRQMNNCVGRKVYTFFILITYFIAILYFRMTTTFLLCFRQFHVNLFCDPRWWWVISEFISCAGCFLSQKWSDCISDSLGLKTQGVIPEHTRRKTFINI